MTAATSASDRYDRARAALLAFTNATPDNGCNDFDRYRLALELADATRALIEAPETASLSDEETQRVYNTAYEAAMPEGIAWRGTEFETAHAAARRALVNAGIQAAWESWEPENAPGMVDTRETYTLASLDGTDDEASWLTAGHVLTAQETEWLRRLEVVS